MQEGKEVGLAFMWEEQVAPWVVRLGRPLDTAFAPQPPPHPYCEPPTNLLCPQNCRRAVVPPLVRHSTKAATQGVSSVNPQESSWKKKNHVTLPYVYFIFNLKIF